MGDLKTILNKAVDGHRISAAEGIFLFENAELLELGLAADAICRRMHPEPYRTYVVDRNINYSNICVSKCKFCAFYRDTKSPDAYVLSGDEIHAKISEAIELGATEILMQGGLHPSLDITWFEHLLQGIKSRFDITMHSLSAPEIVHIARISNLTVIETIARLKSAGIDSIPGGGAEILTDSSRHAISPGKCSSTEWFNVMECAHNLGMRSTATMMFGHTETLAERIQHMAGVRDLQDRTNGFTAFIPWTFQPNNTELGGDAVGGYEYLRTLAISRIFLDNIDNIQASWVTQGSKIGQIALSFGANDLGSTMIEENVVAAAGVTFRMSEPEIRGAIQGTGFIPCRRDTYYHVLEPMED